MRKKDIYPTIIFRMMVFIFSSLLLISSYPNFNLEMIFIIPFLMFGLGLDLITIKHIFEKNEVPVESQNEIVFQPNIGFRASVIGALKLILFLLGLIYFYRHHQNKYLLLTSYAIAVMIPVFLWSTYRDYQRKIVIIKDARIVQVLRKNFLNFIKIEEISLNEFSTITSTIERHKTGKHSYYLKNALCIISLRRKLKLSLTESDPIVINDATTGKSSISENDHIRALREQLATKLLLENKYFEQIDTSYFLKNFG